MMPSSWKVFVFVVSVMHFAGNYSAMVLKDPNGIYTMSARVADEDDLLEEHSQFMLANMDTSVNPCEDFYKYACGNWQNNSMVPPMGRNNTFYFAMKVRVNELFNGFLSNTSAMEENTTETKAKRFYASCKNMSQDLSLAFKTLHDSMKDPVLKDGETLDWMILNFYSDYGVRRLLPFNIKYNTENLMFEIEIGPPAAILTNPERFNFTRMCEDFNFKNKEEVEAELEELVTFEKQLIATTSSLNETVVESIEKFIGKHNYSRVDWKRFFNLAFNGTFKNSWRVHNSVKNFTNLNKFLMRTNADTLFKYVKWLHVMKFHSYGLWKMETYEKTVDGKCREMTIKYFSDALIPWFIETTYDQEQRADMLLLSKRLKSTFYSSLDQNSWLDNATRSEAKSKLRAMDLIVGYTDDMTHRGDRDKEYINVTITNNYWTNLMHLEMNRARIWLKAVGLSTIGEIASVNEVNGFYAEYLNLVYLTVGISQLPLYHITLPNSLKFGGVGSVIGHEIAHGFDSDRYKFDYDGKKRNWWSDDSLRNFKERYQCLESQYNKFIYNGIRTNGSLTSCENVADNAGIRIAFKSYLNFLSESPDLERAKDKPLPGMDFNNKQLFFLKYAQTYCDGRSPGDRMKAMDYDSHANAMFRVLNPLMNMPEFSEEFRCVLGADMNPVKKCVVW